MSFVNAPPALRRFLPSEFRHRISQVSRTGVQEAVFITYDDSSVGLLSVSTTFPLEASVFDLTYTVTPSLGGNTPVHFRYNFCNSLHVRTDLPFSFPSLGPYRIYDSTAGKWGTVLLYPTKEKVEDLLNPIQNIALSSLPYEVTIAGIRDEYSDLCDTAMLRLKPTLTSYDIVQDLVEWKQTKSLFDGLFKIMNPSKEYVKQISRKRTRLSKKYSKKQLEYNFGWVPLYSSLKGVCSALTDVLARVKRWNDNISRIQSKSKVIRSVSEITSGTYSISSHSRVYWNCQQRGTITASLMYLPLPVDSVLTFENRILAAMQYLGVKPDLGIAWDLVPFSFVVDWFINTKDIMSQFSIDLFELRFQMLDFCLALKQDVTISYTYEDDEGVVYVDPVTHLNVYQRVTYPPVIRTISRFQRFVNEPFLPSLIKFGWKKLTGGHVWLGLNLINANK